MDDAAAHVCKQMFGLPLATTMMQIHGGHPRRLCRRDNFFPTVLEGRNPSQTKENKDSSSVPSILAKAGGIYQDAKLDREAERVFEEISQRYPDSPVLSKIQLRVVMGKLNTREVGEAALEAQKLDLEALPSSTQMFLASKFLYPSKSCVNSFGIYCF